MYVKHIYTSIDIGTDTIKIAVCELFNNKLNLLAASSVKSKGIKKGLITDVNEASKSLSSALLEIEDMLGIKVSKAIATIPSYNAEYIMAKGEIERENKDEEITGEDIGKLLKVAIKGKKDKDSEIIGIIPIDFTVDSKTGIKDPKGMVGSIFQVRTILITVPKKNVYSVLSLLENLNVEVVDISTTTIGDIYALKNAEIEKKVGAIIDIGYETTTVSLYNKGIPVKNSIILKGGKNIDSDLAYIYKLSHGVARDVKENFALAHTMYASREDTYEVINKDSEKVRINQYEASEIVMSRIEEILLLARKEINTLTKREVDYILLSGGTSSIPNFNLICDSVLGNIVKLGHIRVVGMRNNRYSTVLGNIIYFIHKLRLRGQDYSMISDEEMENVSSTKKGLLNNISSETMLGKVFGYFLGD